MYTVRSESEMSSALMHAQSLATQPSVSAGLQLSRLRSRSLESQSLVELFALALTHVYLQQLHQQQQQPGSEPSRAATPAPGGTSNDGHLSTPLVSVLETLVAVLVLLSLPQPSCPPTLAPHLSNIRHAGSRASVSPSSSASDDDAMSSRAATALASEAYTLVTSQATVSSIPLTVRNAVSASAPTNHLLTALANLCLQSPNSSENTGPQPPALRSQSDSHSLFTSGVAGAMSWRVAVFSVLGHLSTSSTAAQSGDGSAGAGAWRLRPAAAAAVVSVPATQSAGVVRVRALLLKLVQSLVTEVVTMNKGSVSVNNSAHTTSTGGEAENSFGGSGGCVCSQMTVSTVLGAGVLTSDGYLDTADQATATVGNTQGANSGSGGMSLEDILSAVTALVLTSLSTNNAFAYTQSNKRDGGSSSLSAESQSSAAASSLSSSSGSGLPSVLPSRLIVAAPALAAPTLACLIDLCVLKHLFSVLHTSDSIDFYRTVLSAYQDARTAATRGGNAVTNSTASITTSTLISYDNSPANNNSSSSSATANPSSSLSAGSGANVSIVGVSTRLNFSPLAVLDQALQASSRARASKYSAQSSSKGGSGLTFSSSTSSGYKYGRSGSGGGIGLTDAAAVTLGPLLARPGGGGGLWALTSAGQELLSAAKARVFVIDWDLSHLGKPTKAELHGETSTQQHQHQLKKTLTATKGRKSNDYIEDGDRDSNDTASASSSASESASGGASTTVSAVTFGSNIATQVTVSSTLGLGATVLRPVLETDPTLETAAATAASAATAAAERAVRIIKHLNRLRHRLAPPSSSKGVLTRLGPHGHVEVDHQQTTQDSSQNESTYSDARDLDESDARAIAAFTSASIYNAGVNCNSSFSGSSSAVSTAGALTVIVAVNSGGTLGTVSSYLKAALANLSATKSKSSVSAAVAADRGDDDDPRSRQNPHCVNASAVDAVRGSVLRRRWEQYLQEVALTSNLSTPHHFTTTSASSCAAAATASERDAYMNGLLTVCAGVPKPPSLALLVNLLPQLVSRCPVHSHLVPGANKSDAHGHSRFYGHDSRCCCIPPLLPLAQRAALAAYLKIAPQQQLKQHQQQQQQQLLQQQQQQQQQPQTQHASSSSTSTSAGSAPAPGGLYSRKRTAPSIDCLPPLLSAAATVVPVSASGGSINSTSSPYAAIERELFALRTYNAAYVTDPSGGIYAKPPLLAERVETWLLREAAAAEMARAHVEREKSQLAYYKKQQLLRLEEQQKSAGVSFVSATREKVRSKSKGTPTKAAWSSKSKGVSESTTSAVANNDDDGGASENGDDNMNSIDISVDDDGLHSVQASDDEIDPTLNNDDIGADDNDDDDDDDDDDNETENKSGTFVSTSNIGSASSSSSISVHVSHFSVFSPGIDLSLPKKLLSSKAWSKLGAVHSVQQSSMSVDNGGVGAIAIPVTVIAIPSRLLPSVLTVTTPVPAAVVIAAPTLPALRATELWAAAHTKGQLALTPLSAAFTAITGLRNTATGTYADLSTPRSTTSAIHETDSSRTADTVPASPVVVVSSGSGASCGWLTAHALHRLQATDALAKAKARAFTHMHNDTNKGSLASGIEVAVGSSRYVCEKVVPMTVPSLVTGPAPSLIAAASAAVATTAATGWGSKWMDAAVVLTSSGYLPLFALQPTRPSVNQRESSSAALLVEAVAEAAEAEAEADADAEAEAEAELDAVNAALNVSSSGVSGLAASASGASDVSGTELSALRALCRCPPGTQKFSRAWRWNLPSVSNTMSSISGQLPVVNDTNSNGDANTASEKMTDSSDRTATNMTDDEIRSVASSAAYNTSSSARTHDVTVIGTMSPIAMVLIGSAHSRTALTAHGHLAPLYTSSALPKVSSLLASHRGVTERLSFKTMRVTFIFALVPDQAPVVSVRDSIYGPAAAINNNNNTVSSTSANSGGASSIATAVTEGTSGPQTCSNSLDALPSAAVLPASVALELAPDITNTVDLRACVAAGAAVVTVTLVIRCKCNISDDNGSYDSCCECLTNKLADCHVGGRGLTSLLHEGNNSVDISISASPLPATVSPWELEITLPLTNKKHSLGDSTSSISSATAVVESLWSVARPRVFVLAQQAPTSDSNSKRNAYAPASAAAAVASAAAAEASAFDTLIECRATMVLTETAAQAKRRLLAARANPNYTVTSASPTASGAATESSLTHYGDGTFVSRRSNNRFYNCI